MVISKGSLILKYLFCIDAIALDYRVDLLVWYPLHWQRSQNLLVCISVVTAMHMLDYGKGGIVRDYRNGSKAIFHCGGYLSL